MQRHPGAPADQGEHRATEVVRAQRDRPTKAVRAGDRWPSRHRGRTTGQMNGAAKATTTKKTRTSSPATPLRCLRKMAQLRDHDRVDGVPTRAPARDREGRADRGVAHARVLGSTARDDDVGDDVRGDDRDGEEQEQRLEQGDVRSADGLVGELAEARPAEHGLDVTAPEMMNPTLRKMRVMLGSSALGTACRRRTILSRSPLARAVVR